MPIKFRCRHCRQFLGIAPSRAGVIVDCPTCGRSIRVPELDGRVKKIPQPALNLQDAELAEALDEVAQISEVRSIPVADAVGGVEEFTTSDVLEPEPLPESLPIDPPAPIELATLPPESTSHAAIDIEPHLDQTDHAADEIAALAGISSNGIDGNRSHSVSDQGNSFELRRKPVLFALVVVAVVAFASGYWIRGARSIGELANGSERATTSNDDSAQTIDSGHRVAVRGRITYKSAAGESRADQGARVIAFPPQFVDGKKLSVVGFRVNAVAADELAARDELRRLGGDMSRVDDVGDYELLLPVAGTYRLLVLSRNQSRPVGEPVSAELSQLLEQYFDRPPALLGQLRYHFGRVRYHGSDSQLWDCVFESQ